MTDSQTSRRTFLRATAAGAVALGGGRAFFDGSTADTGDAAGKLVFTYDDGSVEDYTEAFEKAHEPEGVPACTAIPSARVGSPGSLDADQIDEMVAAGWEVMSHTAHHRALTSVELARDVTPGDQHDQRVYVVTNRHGKLPGDQIEIFDGTNSEIATVAGRGEDERGQYVRLEEPTDHAYAVADGARERYTDAVVRTALDESQNQLERELGVEVTNVVMPYAGYGEQPRRMVPDYYTAVANAGGYANGDEALNPIGDLDLPHLSRRYFRDGEMTEAEIQSFLDRVADEDVIGIFGGHTSRTETLPAERIQWTIREAKDRDIDIVTLRQALADRGGSGTTTETTTETTGETTTDSTTTDSTTTDSTTTTNPTTTETTTDSTTTETTIETTTDSTTRTTETTSQTTTGTTTNPTTTETTTDSTTTETPTETTTRTTTSNPTTTETTTETPTETTTRTTSESTTTDTTTADSTTTSSTESNGGATGGTGNTGGGSTSTTTTESTTTGETTTGDATTAEATTETTTETTSQMAVRDNETQMATKTPTTRATPTRTSPTTGTEVRAAPESATTATESSGIDWDALGWVAALGGTGSVAAYFVTRASKTGDESDDE